MLTPRASAADAQPDIVEEFHCASGGDYIVLPVSCGESQFHFVLDTGFRSTCFRAYPITPADRRAMIAN
jgi:hypothetical protein